MATTGDSAREEAVIASQIASKRGTYSFLEQQRSRALRVVRDVARAARVALQTHDAGQMHAMSPCEDAISAAPALPS